MNCNSRARVFRPRIVVLQARIRIPTVLWSVLLLVAAGAAASPENPDVSINDVLHFEIKDRKDHFEVEGRREFEATVLSDRTARKGVVLSFGEGLHHEIDHIKAFVDGRQIGQEHVSWFVPQGKDHFFNESRGFRIVYGTDLEPGQVAGYTYDFEYTDLAYLPLFVLPNFDRIGKWELHFEHPKDVRVDFVTVGGSSPVPVVVERPDTKTTKLLAGPCEGVANLPFMVGNAQRVLILPMFSRDGAPISPTTPATFAAWYFGQFAADAVLDSLAVLPIAAELDAAADNLARLELIYDFVRGHFRYISDISAQHSLVPEDPSLILANRYGDCKDRVALMRAIAARYGIGVQFVLVGSQPGVEFGDRLNFSQFNHVIGGYDTPDGPLYFDPTARHVPFGLLPESDIGQTGLWLAGPDSRLLTIPAPPPPADGAPGLAIALTAHLDSLANAEAFIALRRWYRADAVAGLASTTGLDRENSLRLIAGVDLYKIGFSAMAVLVPGAQAGADSASNSVLGRLDPATLDPAAVVDFDPLLLAARGDLSDFAVFSPTRLYVPCLPVLAFDAQIRERLDDDLPIQFATRRDLSLQLRLVAPGYTARPDSVRLEGPQGMVFSACCAAAAGDTVLFNYVFRREAKKVSGAERDAFMAFATDYLDRKKSMFILDKEIP